MFTTQVHVYFQAFDINFFLLKLYVHACILSLPPPINHVLNNFSNDPF